MDCTLGLGGHSAAILDRIKPNGRLIGIDFDPANIAIAREKLAPIGGPFELHHSNFAALPTILAAADVERVDAVLADLGVASPRSTIPPAVFPIVSPARWTCGWIPPAVVLPPRSSTKSRAMNLNRPSSNSATKPTPRKSPT